LAQCEIGLRPIAFVSNPEQIASSRETTNVETDVEREVRFAVVMYGGVSLAIYINGVTQELLHMVRATARHPKTNEMLFTKNELSRTEVIYRELAKRIDEQAGSEPAEDVTLTRFIVDIISGTSAGGINGVFLAKALARNQTMNGLKRLWLAEGDLGRLLNDTKADDYSPDLGFAVQRPEASLLNSQRMYRKLLEALDQMSQVDSADGGEANDKSEGDEVESKKNPSPLVGELDLFITTTDIEGIPLPINLADKVVYERRYKNVFHFRYATEKATGSYRDDFKKDYDPFLAFAARCTSSFPFAFDAMQLNDIATILNRYREYESDDPKESNSWDHFFKDYLRLGLVDIDKESRGEPTDKINSDEVLKQLRQAFRNRSFADGGYLDNKPFSYATSLLSRRYADCAVERKLLYVEPTPEHPELAPKQPGPRPDFVENVRAAVLDLPRQETIREDLERLYERNDVLERIATFATHVDEDVTLFEDKNRARPLKHDKFGGADLRDMINLYGVSYGAYHRLKVQEITGLIADLITRALGHDPGSDAATVICELVAQWRRQNYSELKDEQIESTENTFLLQFDIRYSLRRLNFLNRRINQLAQTTSGQLDEKAKKLLAAWLEHMAVSLPGDEEAQQKCAQSAQELLGKAKGIDAVEKLSEKWVADFREELRNIKKVIGEALVRARSAEEVFLSADSTLGRKLREGEAAKDFDLSWDTMQDLLVLQDQATRLNGLNKAFEERKEKLTKLIDIIKASLSDREFMRLTIAKPEDVDLRNGKTAARIFLDHYYCNYVLYDLVTYPVEYGTGAGESGVVKVYRVSPEDATSLINERGTGEHRSKLAGRAVMSFGAFLDRRWRKNDMLWGRLDAAERLISILLPGDDAKTQQIREDLIKQAHIGILSEDVTAEDLEQIAHVITDALANCAAGSDQETDLRTFVETLLQSKNLAPTMESALRQCLRTPEDLRRYYKEKYEVDRHLDPENMVRLISRGTAITGNMLEGLADKYRSQRGKRMAHWIAGTGAIFWDVISVAVPQSLGNLFYRHWLSVLYVFDAIMILAGAFLDKDMNAFGWKALGVTAAIHLTVSGLGFYISGKKKWLRALRILLALVVLGLLICGGIFAGQRFTGLHFAGRVILAGLVSAIVLVLVAAGEWRRSKQLKNQTGACKEGLNTRAPAPPREEI
jgi:patatin-related protein